MDKESGKFDYISVNNIDEVQGILEKHYGKDKVPTIENLVIRSHGGSGSSNSNYGPDLDMNSGKGIVHNASSSSGLSYLKNILSNDANILFTACNATQSFTDNANTSHHPYSKDLVENYSKFFLSGTERKMYMNWSKTTSGLKTSTSHYFNFNSIMNKDNYGGFMRFTWGNTGLVYDENFYNISVLNGGLFSSGGLKISILKGRKP